MNISAENASYPEFLALIGQQNAPPGGMATIIRWAEMATISFGSRVLDLACCTGFSSRVLATAYGCHCVGIDLVPLAIREAQYESLTAPLDGSLSYVVADAAALPFPDQNFSHVVAGASFGFIMGRDLALLESARVLERHGSLCVSTFYYVRRPPESVVESVERAIGYRPDTSRSISYWRDFFGKRFELLAEAPIALPVRREIDIETAVRRLIYEHSEKLVGRSPAYQKECFDRLLTIRLALNVHRRYQRACIMHWRLR